MEASNLIQDMRDMTIVASPKYDSITITPNVMADHPNFPNWPEEDASHDKGADEVLEGSGYRRAHSIEMVLPPVQSRWHFFRLKGVERWSSIRSLTRGFLNFLADIADWCADCLETVNELSPDCSDFNCVERNSECEYCEGLVCYAYDTYDAV